MSTKLIVSDGKRERALVLVDKLIVGRDPSCDVSHEDDLLSRRHAEFVVGADTVTVRDLGSRNGIFVNGLRTAERALYPGDVVQIGPLRVLYAHDVSRDSILPEQVLADRTMVVPPRSTPTPAPIPPALADEERTQVLGTPVPPARRPASVVPAPPPAVAQPQPPTHAPANPSFWHDGPTQFIPPPTAARDAARDGLAREAVASPAEPSAPSGTSATRITPAPATPRPSQPPATPAAAPTPARTPPAAAIVAPPDAPPVAPPPATPLQVTAPPPAAPGVGAPPRSATATPAPPARESFMEPTRLAPPPAIAGRSVESELTGYVFGQAATLGIVVLLSALVPLWLVRSDAMGVWLVVPIVMTIATTYLVAGFINRRFARIVRALQPETMSGESFRGSRGSPSGLFRS